ncbi:MAG: homocysteine S-methyltransferase family protein [Pseudomonadota bacterium]
MAYAKLKERLVAGEVILLDGGTGTELERRGVTMNPDAWCGPATLGNTEVLRDIHVDYINAGAEIVTANTYASSRLMLEPAGFGDKVGEINRTAVETVLAAREASGRDDVVVAASLSHMAPIHGGTSTADATQLPSPEVVEDALSESARIFADAGAELILLEMVYRPMHLDAICRAAASSGLPFWVGFSCRRGDDGSVLAFERHSDVPFADIIDVASRHDADAAGVMHTPSNLIGDAIDILKAGYDGPLTAYPDSGYFKMPEWQFEDIIPPADLVDYAEHWYAQGVRAFGGCCGLSPEHISALAGLRTPQAA